MTDDGNATQPEKKKRKKTVPRPFDRSGDKGGGWQGGGRPKGLKDTKPRKKYVHFTPALKWKFLDTLAANGSIRASAALVDISEFTIFAHMRKDDHFNDLVETALAKYLSKLEDEFQKRIFEGNETLEYDGDGVLIRKVVKKDNDLLKMALKATDKEKYGDKGNSTNVTIDANSAIGKLAEFLKLDLPDNSTKEIEGDFRKVDSD